MQCHRWADTGKQGLLADPSKHCPKQEGSSWHKKYRALGKTVFQQRLPPNPKRHNDRVHAVIPLDDDPRTVVQLRYHQEFYESYRAEAIGRIVSGPEFAVTANEDEPSKVNTTGRARRRHSGPTTVPLLENDEHPADDEPCRTWQLSQGDTGIGAQCLETVDTQPARKKPRALQNFPTFPTQTTPKRPNLAAFVRTSKSARTQ